ncbi:transposase [Streptomyces sp. NPDC088560]|uniref:IS110 family transposase n=1 Tax=Streptomyces sp. NPDC088560 TaxID=3365868 RepID=UPI003818A523
MIGGIDTHTDVHEAAVIDTIGRYLATEAFPTTHEGYRRLLAWLRSHDQVLMVGMEGTGSFGAELARYQRASEITLVEADRLDRRTRRAAGKSDPAYAYAAATAVLPGRANGTPEDRDATGEATHALRVVRASAIKARTQTVNQPTPLIITAPAATREAPRSLTTAELIGRLVASRPGSDLTTPSAAVKPPLKCLAERYQHLSEEIAEADAELRTLITHTAPGLLATRSRDGNRRAVAGHRRGQPRQARLGSVLRPPMCGRTRAGCLGPH